MRQTSEKQLSISEGWPDHKLSKELRVISEILDRQPGIYDTVLKDITQGKRTDVGAKGMSCEQAVRCTILKRMFGFSYEKLSFHLSDSGSFREFARIGYGEKVSRSRLQDNIRKITMETWEEINRIQLRYGKEKKIETGRKGRGDCTVVETHIHMPHDGGQLWDCVRVVSRAVVKLHQAGLLGGVKYQDHRRRAKRRCCNIMNAKDAVKRKGAYRDLVWVAEDTYRYGVDALGAVTGMEEQDRRTERHITKLAETLKLMPRVIDQAKRRVFGGENVPSGEKVVSIFEPHTDIIEKKGRPTEFGHKIALMMGKSGMILDCMILKGNPADTSLAVHLVERQEALWGRVPRQVAFDGGFASKPNLNRLKQMGVKDVSFSKKRGLQVSAMVKSAWVYKQLKRFRAGIEGCISTLKRAFNLRRCDWRRDDGFERYVWSGAVTYNLVVLARHMLQ